MMDHIIEIKNILKDCTFEVCQKKSPTYIQPFIHDQDIVLIYKPISVRNGSEANNSVYEDISCSALELTGTPLECPFSPVKSEATFLSVGSLKQWLTEEETHGPVSMVTASNMLSMCNLHVRNWKLPVWVVCDGEDSHKTVLLSAFQDEIGWITRSSVRFVGRFDYNQAEQYAIKMKEEHLRMSGVLEHQMEINMIQTFEIFGSMGNYENCTENSITLRLSWACSSSPVIAPPSYAETILEMIIVMEKQTSKAHELWEQLKFLNELANVLESLKGRKDDPVVEIPKLNNGEEVCETIGTAEILDYLHESDYTAFSRPGNANVEKESSAALQQLNHSVTQAVSGKSMLYLDFSHLLFLVLAKCKDSENLKNCINCVFQEVWTGGTKLLIHPDNGTTIAKYLRELMKNDRTIPEISGIKALQLLLEIGLEKLSKDYAHIFMSSDLTTYEQLKLFPKSSDLSENPSQKLDTLARLHVILEMLLLAESQLEFSVSTLQRLAASILNNIQSQVASFHQLLERTYIKLQAPVPTKEIQCHLTRRYSTWCMQITSEREKLKLDTTLHFSNASIFPYFTSDVTDSQIYEDTMITNEELFCSQKTSISNKLK